MSFPYSAETQCYTVFYPPISHAQLTLPLQGLDACHRQTSRGASAVVGGASVSSLRSLGEAGAKVRLLILLPHSALPIPLLFFKPSPQLHRSPSSGSHPHHASLLPSVPLAVAWPSLERGALSSIISGFLSIDLPRMRRC